MLSFELLVRNTSGSLGRFGSLPTELCKLCILNSTVSVHERLETVSEKEFILPGAVLGCCGHVASLFIIQVDSVNSALFVSMVA